MPGAGVQGEGMHVSEAQSLPQDPLDSVPPCYSSPIHNVEESRGPPHWLRTSCVPGRGHRGNTEAAELSVLVAFWLHHVLSPPGFCTSHSLSLE